MKYWSYLHWNIFLVQDLELWEVLLMESPLMVSQMVTNILILRAIGWDYHWEQKLDIHWEAPMMECQAQMWR